MDQNMMDCELAERDPGMCVCKRGLTLEILKDIQRLYEEKMEVIEKAGGSGKLQMQVDVLKSWVGDLVGQNTLLARAVEELETEATTKLLMERRKNSEVVSELRAECAALRRRLARKDSDLRGLVELLRRLREFDCCNVDDIHFFEVTQSDILGSLEWRQKKPEQGDLGKQRGALRPDIFKNNRHYRKICSKSICEKVSALKILNESLHKENISKDREIRQLNKDAQSYEQTIMNLRKEMSNCQYHTPDVSKKDAEVMAGMCCTGTECGEWEPVKDFSELLRDETSKYQEGIKKMETNLKSSSDSVRALRKVNVTLSEEMHAMRRVCAALDEQCRAANLRAQFKDDIIKEMRRQLKQAKAKLKESSDSVNPKCKDYVSGDAACGAGVAGAGAGAAPSYESVTVACVRAQPRRKRDVPLRPYDCRTAANLSHEDSINASTSCELVTSTPNSSRVHLCSRATSAPNVSVIERCTSAPVLISELDFARNLNKCAKSTQARDSTSCSCSRKESPRSCLKKLTPARCVHIQTLDCKEKPKCVEELYFNDETRSCDSSSGGQCIKRACRHKLEIKPVCSSMTKIEKEMVNRSCGRNVKDSGGPCSLVGSTSATCDASERAQYYQNKLLSTEQILQNKEETIRVQAESLTVAEARIATLSDRANNLKRELDKKTKEYHCLLKTVDCCKVQKSDACIITDKQEEQRDIVSTLQDNLSVIEDLYRECFYETAKQENLIDMLRSSILDVRLMDKQKADKIGHLQTVIKNQKWSLERCQDIALEVDSLKMEISNFLHSSASTNNDSGMWERSEESYASVPGVQEDLQDVTELLLRLQALITTECTCGLKEENRRLKDEVKSLEITLGELRGRLCELECTLEDKRSSEALYQAEIESKDKELQSLRDKIVILEEASRDHIITCDALSTQLRHVKALLDEKTAELAQVQEQNDLKAKTIRVQQEELDKADQMIGENCKLRSEVSYLNKQVSLRDAALGDCRRRARALDAQLARLDTCYREKVSTVSQLEAQLGELHAHGAALCGVSRHCGAAVRHWQRRVLDRIRQQENIIKAKDELLSALQRRLEERQSESQRTSASENTTSCSKCLSDRTSGRRDQRCLCSKSAKRRQNRAPATSSADLTSLSTMPDLPACSRTLDLPTCSRTLDLPACSRTLDLPACSGTLDLPASSRTIDLPTCSRTSDVPPCTNPSVPVRVLRKKPGGKRYAWLCDAAVQEPIRRDGASNVTFCEHHDVRPVRVRMGGVRDVFPTEEFFYAWSSCRRRWSSSSAAGQDTTRRQE